MAKPHFLLRKVLHALFGVLALFLAIEIWTELKPAIFRWVLVAALLLFLALDYLRIELGVKLPLYEQTAKPKEEGHMHAMTFGVIGTALTFLLFDFTIAFTALAMFYLGDPAAALTGTYFGKHRIRRKTLEGSLAFLAVAFGIGYVILQSWKVAALMAITAALTELLLDRMDDNLVVPLTTGTIGMIFAIIWHLP